jgi:hypothetical protein
MIKNVSTKILTDINHAVTDVKPWDEAIADAQDLIEENHTSVRQLKRSIGLMRELRDKGAAFPGVGAIQGLGIVAVRSACDNHGPNG